MLAGSEIAKSGLVVAAATAPRYPQPFAAATTVVEAAADQDLTYQASVAVAAMS